MATCAFVLAAAPLPDWEHGGTRVPLGRPCVAASLSQSPLASIVVSRVTARCYLVQVRENNAALAQDLMVAGGSAGRLPDGAAPESLTAARGLQAEPKPKKAGATPLDIARVKAETEALKKQVDVLLPRRCTVLGLPSFRCLYQLV